METQLRDKIARILGSARDLAIATVREDGFPQNTVVSFVHDGLTIYFGCGAESQKALNIERDGRVSIAATAPYDAWSEIQGLSMSARARLVTDPAQIERVGAMMLERFPEVADLQDLEPAQLAVFEVTPEVVSVLDYSLGFGHTDTVIVSAGDIAQTRAPSRHVWVPAGS
jgi:general stress protein 26